MLIVILILAVTASNSNSQTTYQRKAVVEEMTGTWCGHCTLGAWSLDSLHEKYGDNIVLIAWHGPRNYNEPMWIPAIDTLTASFGITGYPGALLNRMYSGGFYEDNNKGSHFNQESRVPQEMNKKAEIDFRIVNLTYNAGTKMVEFDCDITPLDITKMMSEDTTNYVTIAVLTEDGITESQANYGHGGLPNANIDDFVHKNVVRRVGGKVMGDKYTLGTKLAKPTFPVRVHYKMSIASGWNPDKIRAKAFTVAVHPKTGNLVYNEFHGADQTDYVGGVGPEPAPGIWIILPSTSYVIKANQPTNIVYGKSSTVGNVKIEYTVDGGLTWKTIIASTNESPYAWTLDPADYGKTVQFRIVDVNNSGVYALSAPMPTPGIITVTKPAAGDTVWTGTQQVPIEYTAQQATLKKTFSYSVNGGLTWTKIADFSSDATTFLGWNAPLTPSPNAQIKIEDANGVVGLSGIFVIANKVNPINPEYADLQLAGVVGGKIDSKSATIISWTQKGDVGEQKTIKMSSDNKATWQIIKTVTGKEVVSANWVTPDTNLEAVYFQISDEKGITYTTPSTVWIYKETQQGAVKNIGGAPTQFTMSSNYPNPVRDMTNIEIGVPSRSFVQLVVHNELGIEVARLVNETLEAGTYNVDLTAKNLAAGTYTYTLTSGSTKLVGKMSVIK
jgi:hypothetical protein